MKKYLGFLFAAFLFYLADFPITADDHFEGNENNKDPATEVSPTPLPTETASPDSHQNDKTPEVKPKSDWNLLYMR